MHYPLGHYTRVRNHRLGAETGKKNACRIVQARDNQGEWPATVAGQGPYGKSRLKNKQDALQESTMEFHDTYLNKVFISLRFFELPPWLARVLTHKKLYRRGWYRRMYNLALRFVFASRTPNRWIRPPQSPFAGKVNENRIRLFFRWPAWALIESSCRWMHRRYERRAAAKAAAPPAP